MSRIVCRVDRSITPRMGIPAPGHFSVKCRVSKENPPSDLPTLYPSPVTALLDRLAQLGAEHRPAAATDPLRAVSTLPACLTPFALQMKPA